MAAKIGGVLIQIDVDASRMSNFSRAATTVARDSARMRSAAVGAHGAIAESIAKTGQAMTALHGPMGGIGARFRALGQLAGSANAALVATGVSAAGAAFGLTKFIQTADKMRLMENQLKTVTGSSTELADVHQRLFDVSQRSRASWEATTTIYARVARASEHLGISQTKLIRLAETVQKAFAVGGATPQEAYGAAIQLSQGIASNRFSGEEFRSVAENAPVLLKEMAEQLGVNIGKLREMAHAGELTGDVVTKAIIGASEAIDADFAKTTSTVGQALSRTTNAYEMYVYQADKSLGISSAVAKMLNSVADNFDVVGDSALFAAAAVATFLAGRGGAAALRGGSGVAGNLLSGGLFYGVREQAKKDLAGLNDYLKEIKDRRIAIENEIKGIHTATGDKIGQMRVARSDQMSGLRQKEIDAQSKINGLTQDRIALTSRLGAEQDIVVAKMRAEQSEAKKAVDAAQRRVNLVQLQNQRANVFGRVGNPAAEEREQRKLNAAKEEYGRISARIAVADRDGANAKSLRGYGNEYRKVSAEIQKNTRAMVSAQNELKSATEAVATAQTKGATVIAAANATREKALKRINVLQMEQVRLSDHQQIIATRIAGVRKETTLLGAAAMRTGALLGGMWGMLGGTPGVAIMGIVGALTYYYSQAHKAAERSRALNEEMRDLKLLSEDAADAIQGTGRSIEQMRLDELKVKLQQVNAEMKNMVAAQGAFGQILNFDSSNLGNMRDIFAFMVGQHGDTAEGRGNQALVGIVDALLTGQGEAKELLAQVDAVGRTDVSQPTLQWLQHLRLAIQRFEALGLLSKKVQENIEGAVQETGKLGRVRPQSTDQRFDEKRDYWMDENNLFRRMYPDQDPLTKEMEDRAKKAREAAEELQTALRELRMEAEVSGFEDWQKDVISAAKSMGVTNDEIQEFIDAVKSGDFQSIPDVFHEIIQSLEQIAKNEFLKSLQELRLDGAVAQLSRVDQELVAMARSAGLSQDAVQELIKGLTSGDISGLPAVLQEARQELEKISNAEFTKDIMFERDQIGRSDIDATIYEELYRAGLDINSVEGQRRADNIRINELLKEQQGILEDIGKTIKDGIGNALKEAFTGGDWLGAIVSMGDKLASMNFDSLVDGFLGKDDNIFSAPKMKAAGKVMGDEVVKIVASNDNWAGLRDVTGAGAQAFAPGGSYTSGAPIEVNLASRSAASVQRAGNAFLDLVASRESGADGYNATLANGAFTGGRRTLVTMTLSQIDDLQTMMLNHPKNNYGASPVGAYQIVQKTLRGLKEQFNLSGDTLFTPKLQDELAVQLARARGGNASNLRNEWEGLRGVDSATIENAYRRGIQGQTASVTEAVETGAQIGTEKGATRGVQVGAQKVAENQAGGAAGGGGQVFGGMLSAGLGGFSTGFQAADPGMGALGGGMQGLGAGLSLMQALPALGMALPVIGAFVGAAAGLLGGILGAQKKLKEAKRQLEKQMNAINSLLAVGEGRGIGAMQDRLNDYLAEVDKAVDLAWKAKEMDLVERLQQSYNKYWTRLNADFENGFAGMLKAYNDGMGEESPFLKGQRAIEKLREEIRAMIADVRFFGESRLSLTPDTPEKAEERAALEERLATEMALATEAGQNMAISFMVGSRQMTEMEANVQSLQGEAAALRTTLAELGMAVDEVASTIANGFIKALIQLQATLQQTVVESINQMSGYEYLNEIHSAQTTYKERLRDFAALGMDATPALVELNAALRQIASEAELTDDQLRQLATVFPEIGASILGMIGADTSTAAQAVADAKAKVDEAKSNLRAAYQEEANTLESTIEKMKSFIKGLKEFKDQLRLDTALSPLSPYDRMKEAERQFNSVSTRAMNGDEEALGELEGISREYLEAARAYYGDSTAYFSIFYSVEDILDQALARAGQQLSQAERQLEQLKAQVEALIDIDESVKTVGEAVAELAAAEAALAAAEAAKTAADAIAFQQMIDLLALMAAAEATRDTSGGGSVQYSAADPIANAYRQYLGREPDAETYAFYAGNLAAGLTTVDAIVADIKKHAQDAGIYTGYASGGYTGNMDPSKVAGYVHGREFVMNAAATERWRPQFEMMNKGMWPQVANDNEAGLSGLISQLLSAVQSGGNATVEQLRQVSAGLAEQVREVRHNRTVEPRYRARQ